MSDTRFPSVRSESGLAAEERRSGAVAIGCVAYGLGALAAICWLAALVLDLQTTHLPGWARVVPHAALVLAVPALVILVAQARVGRRGTLRWWATVLALVVMVTAALPGLLLVSQSQDLASLPLRIPSLGLGVALGYVVPFRRAAYGVEQRGHAAATLGGAGFAVLLLPAGFVLVIIGLALVTGPACPPHQVDCGPGGTAVGTATFLELVVCSSAFLTALLGLAAAALGGEIGRALGQLGVRHHS